MRKALETYSPEPVFIRRHGQADQADADELRMLQRRLLAGTSHIQLSVEPVVPQIEAHTDLRGRIDNWIDHERAHCEPDPDDLEEQPRKLSSLFRQRPSADYRTASQYKAQMTNYFLEAKIAVLKRAVWELARHDPTKLALQIVNRGERNYTEVVVMLRIESGAVHGYDTESLELFGKEEPPLPRRPDPWGTQTATRSVADGVSGANKVGVTYGVAASGSSFNIVESGRAVPWWSHGWRAVNDADGVDIEFAPCNLRASRNCPATRCTAQSGTYSGKDPQRGMGCHSH